MLRIWWTISWNGRIFKEYNIKRYFKTINNSFLVESENIKHNSSISIQNTKIAEYNHTLPLQYGLRYFIDTFQVYSGVQQLSQHVCCAVCISCTCSTVSLVLLYKAAIYICSGCFHSGIETGFAAANIPIRLLFKYDGKEPHMY